MKFPALGLRARQIDRAYGPLAETFAGRTTAERLDLLSSRETPLSPLSLSGRLFDNPHPDEAGFFETVGSSYERMRFPSFPTWFSQTPGKITRPESRLGEHTDEVLRDIGD